MLNKLPNKFFRKKLLSLSLLIGLTSVNLTGGFASEINLNTPAGANIKGLLVKKSEKEIEVQTEHGIVEIREKDVTPQAWGKAQATIVSSPKKLKNEGVMPNQKLPKEIKVSSKPEENSPVAIPYTGFLNEANSKTVQTDLKYKKPPNNQNTSVLYMNTTNNKLWTLEPQNPQLPDYKTIEGDPNTIAIKLPTSKMLANEVIHGSKKDAVRIFFPLTIVALSLILLAKSTLPLKTKIASYLILGLLLLSIILENTLFGILAIASLCILMLILEILTARAKAIEEALGNTKIHKKTLPKEPLSPHKTLNITPNQLTKLEWRKFEEFCCLWLEQNEFEVNRTTPIITNTSTNRFIDGRYSPKLTHGGYIKNNQPAENKFRALYKNLDKPVTIKDMRELKKSCTSSETPIIISIAEFEEESVTWAKDDQIRLISNREITKKFNSLPSDVKTTIIKEIWDGQEEVPTCPVCIQKMTSNKNHADPKGNYKTQIWYCNNYKTCHQRIVAKNPSPIENDILYPDFSKINNL